MKLRSMTLIGLVTLFSLSPLAMAQQDHNHGGDGGQGGGGRGGMQQGQGGGGMGNMMMERMTAMHDQWHAMGDGGAGQAAFATIKTLVDRLQADPNTDWSQVDIDALHQHLVDMHHLTIEAQVASTPVTGGALFQIIGTGRTLEAIQRMVPMHGLEVAMSTGWKVETLNRDDGMDLTVTATDPVETAKIRAIGFMGFMVQGDHHGDHHEAMAGLGGGDAAEHGGHAH